MPKKVTLKEFGKHIQDVYGIPEGKFELEQIARDYVNKHPSYKDRVDWLSAERERMRPREITPTDKVPAAPQHIQERFKPKQLVEETIAQPVKPTTKEPTKEPTEQPKPIAKEQAGIPASPERYQRMEGKPSIPGVSPLSTKDQIIRMHGWDQEIGELVAQRDDLEKNRRSIESQINQWAEKSITSKPMRVFGEPAEKYENRLFQDLRAANEQIDGKGGINEQIQVIHNRSQKLADKLDEAKETLRDASMEEIFAVYDLYGRDVDITTAGEVIKYTREKTELVGKINDIDSQIADLLEKTKGQRKDRLLIHSKIHTLQEQRNNTLEQIEKIKSELKVRTPAYIEELELQQQEMYGKRLVEAQNKRDIGAAIHDFTFRGVAKPVSYIEAGLGIDLAKPLADATKEFVKGINSGLIHTEKSYHGMLAMFEEDPIKRDQHLLKAQRAQKAGDVFAIKQPQFTEVQSAEDFGQWLGGSVGNLLPIVSQYMLAAKVGGIAGAKVGALGGPKGAMIGGLIGSSAASATHGWLSYGGDMFSDLSAMGIEYSEAKRIASQQAIPASLFSIAVPTGLTQVSMGFWKSVGGREFARNKFKSYIKMGLMAGPAEATGEALAQTWGVMRAFERADLETYTWNDYFKGGVDAGAPAFLMPFTTGIMGVGLKPSAVAEAETRLQHVNVTQKEKQSLQAFIKDAYDKQLDENVNLYTDLIETVEGQSDRPFARRFLIDDMKKLKEQGRLDNELESMLDWLEDFELKSETRTDKRKEISELNDALNFLDETAFKVRNRTDEQNTQAMMDLAEKNEKDILDYHEAVETMAIYTNKPKIFVEVYKQIIEKRDLARTIEFNKGDFLVNQYTYQGEGENDGMVVKGMTMRDGQEVTVMVVNEKGDLLAVRYPDTEEVEFKPRRDVEITETVPRQDEIDMVNEQIAQQEAVEQAETMETAGMIEDLGLAGAQQIQPGMVVRHKGREGVVEEKFNPDWGLLVRMGDETFRVPVEEIGMVEMVKDQDAQVETPSPTLVLEDQEYRLNPIADNVWSVLEIGDAKQAETIVSGLAAKYPNLVFEVHNRTDLTNPFAEANYEITAKTREAAEVVAETEEAPVKETPVETQAEAPIETPEGIPAKWGDEDVLIVEGDPSVDDTVTILKDGERQDIFSNEITVESPAEAEAPAEAPIETTPEEKGVIDLTKKRPRGKLLSNLQKQASDYEPSTPFEAALQYFIAGNHAFYEKDNPKSALHQLFGTKVGDPRTQKKVESERKPRFIWMSKKGKTIDEIAHYLWETYPDISEDSQDFRIAVEDVIKDFNSPQQMAIHMVKSRDVDAAMDEYGKVEQEYMEQFDEESLQEQGETVEREGEEIASELIPQHIINTLERENITLDNVHKLEWLFDKQEDYENVKEYLRQRLADEEDTRVPEAERPDREGKRVETEAAQEVALTEQEKQPWEMTRDEHRARHGIKYNPDTGYYTVTNIETQQEVGSLLKKEGVHDGTVANILHSNLVQQALSEGKEVPAEVLKDYPELAKEKQTIAERLNKKFNTKGNNPSVGMPLKGVKQIYTDEEYKGKNVSKDVQKDAEKLLDAANKGDTEQIKAVRDKYFAEWNKSKSQSGTQQERYIPINTAKVELYNIANAMLQEVGIAEQTERMAADVLRPETPINYEDLKDEAAKHKTFESFKSAISRSYTERTDDVSLRPIDIIEAYDRAELDLLSNYDLLSKKEWLGKDTEYQKEIPKTGELTVYRATEGNFIRPGDYVTQSKKYAQMHLDSILKGEGKIIKRENVGLDELAVVNPNEFWYAPKEFQITQDQLRNIWEQSRKKVPPDILARITPARYVRADRQAADILTERPTYEPKGNTAILNKAIQGAELQTALKDARDIDPTAYLSTRESGIVFASQELTHQFINQQNEKQGLPTQDFEVTKTVTEKPAQNLSQAQRQRVNELTKEYEGQIEESESNLTIAKDRLKKKRAEFSTAMQTQMFDTDKQVSMFDTQADPKAVDAALKPYTDAVEFYEKQAKKLKDNKDKTTERIIKEQQGQTEVKFRMHGREIVDHDQKEAWTQSDVEKAVKQTVDRFGLTQDINEAGWILTDGRMVDHSGKADGLTPGTRNYNSYKVGETLRGIDLKNFKPTVLIVDGHAHRMSAYGEMAFLDMDNIAVTNEGIKIKHQPTSQQLDIIREYAEGREQITMNIKGYQVTVPADQAVDYIQRRFQDTERPVYGHYSISPARIYQNVDYALKSTKMEKDTKEQWRAELTKLGAKQYELEWKGFDELPAHMERSEIEQWAKDSRVEVEVIRRGDEVGLTEEQIKERREYLNKRDELISAQNQHFFIKTRLQDAINEENDTEVNRYREQYKNFAEHHELSKDPVDFYENDDILRRRITRAENLETEGKYQKYTTPGGENYQEVLLTLPGIESEFKTQHWAEPNVVVSIRHKDFQGDDGRRILMVEEMQSDWAQKGRREGFARDFTKFEAEIKEAARKNNADMNEVQRAIDHLKQEPLDTKERPTTWAWSLLHEAVEGSGIDLNAFHDISDRTIPLMPFQKTDQWVGLAWKHILEYAVDNGYDGVALTKGEQQAERYDLSKQVDRIDYFKNNNTLAAYKAGEEVINTKATAEELPNLIGKEAAERILREENTMDGNTYSLKGDALKVGGLGMLAFYNNIAPKWINKNLKKHGIRVSEYDLGTQIDQETGDITNPVKVHYFPLNESLYEQVSKEGMPMFALEGKTAKNHPKVKKVIDELTQRAPNAQDSAVIAYQKDLVSEMKANGESDVVIQSVLKKIKEGGTINAFVSPGTGRAYFISENMPSDTGSIIKTWIHEQGIHAGLESLIPDSKQRNRLLETVFDNVGEDGFKEMMGETYKYYKDETKATKGNEYLARLSEKMDAGQLLTPAEKTAWQKIKDFINNLISQVFNRHIKLSDNELRDIVRASVQSMVQGLEVESKTGRTQEGIQTSINFKIDGKRVSEPIDPGWWAKLTRAVQNRMQPVKRVQQEITRRMGKIPWWADAYRYENTIKSRMMHKWTEFQKHEWLDLTNQKGNLLHKGMSDRDVHLYNIAKGAQDRNFHLKMTRDVEYGSGLSDREAGVIVQIFEHGITKDEAIFLLEGEIGPAHNDVVEFVKNTEFYGKKVLTAEDIDAYWKAVQTVNDYKLNIAVETGLLDRQTTLEWKKQYGKHYVPLLEWDGKTPEDVFEYIRNDRSGKSALFKKAKGRTTLPADPIPRMGALAHSVIVKGEKNLAKKRLFHLAELNPDMKDLLYAETVYNVFDGTDWKETTTRPPQELWDKGWVKMNKNEQHTYRLPRELSKLHEMEVFINGEKKIVVAADPLVIRPYMQPDAVGTDFFRNSWFSRYTRALSKWHTRNNPSFILPNLGRDIQFGHIYHAIEKRDKNYLFNYTKNYLSAEAATRRWISGKADQSKEADRLYFEWREHGGPTGHVYTWTVDEFQKDINRTLKEIEKNKFDQVNLFKAEARLTGKLAQWSEDIPRFNTYLTSRKMGRSILQSIEDSKESSVNFDRKGYYTGIMSSMWVFANSRIQGVERLGRVSRNETKRAMGMAALLMAKGFMESYMYDVIAGEDEEGIRKYDRLSEYIRGRYAFFSIPGTDKVVTIPGPHGWRAFSGLGSIAYDVYSGRKTMQEALPWVYDFMTEAYTPVDMGGFWSKDHQKVRPYRLMPTASILPMEITLDETFTGRTITRQPFTAAQDYIPHSQRHHDFVNKTVKFFTDSWFELGGGDKEIANRNYYKDGKLRTVPRMFDINPAYVEHIASNIFGGKGYFYKQMWGMAESTVLFAKEILDEERKEGLWETARELYHPDDIPVTSRFLRQPRRDPLEGWYWDKRREDQSFLQTENSYKQAWYFDKVKEMRDDPTYAEIVANVEIVHETIDNLRRQEQKLRAFEEDNVISFRDLEGRTHEIEVDISAEEQIELIESMRRKLMMGTVEDKIKDPKKVFDKIYEQIKSMK